MKHTASLFSFVGFILAFGSPALFAGQSLRQIGVAKIDITPAYPIRLCGYAVRKKESEGVAQHLWAKALAIGSDNESPAILITVDNTGVPASIRNEVARRLEQNKGIRSERIALCSSHSHTAPCLAGNLPTLFGEPLPPEHEEHVRRYTAELTDALENVALAALKNRQSSTLERSEGKATFAANRRTKGGPVDHDMPILVARDAKNNIRAILANYACHCTTLGGDTNLICGDWAGYAQEYLERDHPGAIAFTTIGCGADANPAPRSGLDFAKQHGAEIENAVNDMLGFTFAPVIGLLECRAKTIDLPFDKPRTRADWEEMARQAGYPGYYAKVNLAKLDRGESLPTALPYIVQTWNFGHDLAMVFLAGEVVVDYSLRLKRELDPGKIWITAYANDVPCYIPSERILTEGGYEGGGAMIYYDKPNRLAPGVEALIVNTVHELVPKSYAFDQKTAEFPSPLSPEDSLKAMRTRAGLNVELVAQEPSIVDPVAIDWGADGRLWVAEMRDYPMGMDGKWKPGSRVRLLEDTHGNGRYDKSSVFLDNLPFITGVTAWRKGVLICAAPDILYAEDTNHDGKADVIKKIFTGFATENYQARVNSLSLGLDNWVHGANGLLGGAIERAGGSNQQAARTIDIRGRDFRMNPDTGAFEPESGLTQQGRVRDDWGHWFGCDNSVAMWHYPVADHYIRRNPFVAAPSPRVSIASGDDPTLLHPLSRTLERFNNPQSANRITSACGLGIYRDTLLGTDFSGDGFVCEPVHNLVHRLKLIPEGGTFSAVRAAGESQAEFLASRDNWFRPVQVRTGPDGALYVVDMYRFVIEHPRWISAERLAKLDVRAGADKGRIYRIAPPGQKLKPIRNLTRLSTPDLAAALNNRNGTERDRVHQELLCRHDPKAIPVLARLVGKSSLPETRLQALCALDGLGAVSWELLARALSDPHPGVRANAVRLSEPFLGRQFSHSRDLSEQLNRLVDDSNFEVRLQLALSLGASREPWATAALAHLAAKDPGDVWMRTAILGSSVQEPAPILKTVIALDVKAAGRAELLEQLIATAAGQGNQAAVADSISAIVPTNPDHPEPWQFTAMASLLDSLERKHAPLPAANSALPQMFERARLLVSDPSTPAALRDQAIRLLGRQPESVDSDLRSLVALLDQSLPAKSLDSTLNALRRIRSPRVPELLLENWPKRTPALRQGILTTLLSREEWISPLLASLEKNEINPREISPADRRRLLKHANASIQSRSHALWQNSAASRSDVISRFKAAESTPGDESRGSEVFAKNCSTCHSLHGQGFSVGPNLAALADKPPADLLTAILDPNAVVEPRFIAYNIETKDGRSLSGIVSAETATTLTLVQSGGAQEKILRGDVAEIRASGLSLMPEGLEQAMSVQDLADVIAYLKTSPRQFGTASDEQIASARHKFLAAGANGCDKIIHASESLPYPGWLGTLTMVHCRQTDGNSSVEWSTAPVAGIPPAGLVVFRLPVAMGFASNPPGKFQLSLNGKLLFNFDVSLTDHTWQGSDGKSKMSYAVMEYNDEDSNGVLTIEVPASLLETGKSATFKVLGSAANSQRWFGIYQLPPA